MKLDSDWAVFGVCFLMMFPFMALAVRCEPEPLAGGPGAVKCQAARGWWVAATLDKHGNPSMWACVDDAGHLVRLSEAE